MLLQSMEANEIAEGILKRNQPELSEILLQNEAIFQDVSGKLYAEEVLPPDRDISSSIMQRDKIDELLALLSEAVMKNYINLSKTIKIMWYHEPLAPLATEMSIKLGEYALNGC